MHSSLRGLLLASGWNLVLQPKTPAADIENYINRQVV
jgi:hypothetical protein